MGIKKELHAYQTFRRKHIVSLKKILKESPQLSKYFSFFNEIETKFWTKVAWKAKKKRVSMQKSFNLFPRKIFIQILYVYIVRNMKPWTVLSDNQCVQTTQNFWHPRNWAAL